MNLNNELVVKHWDEIVVCRLRISIRFGSIEHGILKSEEFDGKARCISMYAKVAKIEWRQVNKAIVNLKYTPLFEIGNLNELE